MSQSLLVSREGRILRLTMSRPEKRNALSHELCCDLVAAIQGSWTDRAIGCILLESTGDVFCAGMDLDDASEADAQQRTAIHEQLFTLGARSPKPIVAAVGGPALGGGVGLIANAHIAVAAHGCTFGLTEVRIGMWPFFIFRSVANAIGERRMLELSLTGRIFHLPEAVSWGLISEAVPKIELDDRATAIAEHLAASSPQAIAAGLAFVTESRGTDPATAARIAATYRSKAFESSDFAEGVRAFREKRKPSWNYTGVLEP